MSNQNRGTVSLKLVGARNFACAPAGIVDPVVIGSVVQVTQEVAVSLRKLTSYDKRGNTIKMFSDDVEARVEELPGPKVQTLDDAVASGDAAKGPARSKPQQSAPDIAEQAVPTPNEHTDTKNTQATEKEVQDKSAPDKSKRKRSRKAQ